MLRTVLLVAMSLAAFSSIAAAQGTPGERSACRSDVRRLCAKAGEDQFEVLSCLQTHRTRLSKGCKSVLASHGQLGS